MFPEEKRRKINLGGRSCPSQTSIINEAKAIRNLRQHQKLQADSASRLQARWRGILCRRRIRDEFKASFEADILGITGIRSLALLAEEEMLIKWANTILTAGEANLFMLAQGKDRDSWLVLIRRVAFLLAQYLARATSDHRESFLRILDLLLVPANIKRHLGKNFDSTLSSIMSYLLNRKLIWFISATIGSIPVQSKTDPCLPLLTPLIVAPFEVYSSTSPDWKAACESVFVNALTIPLLPNRIPIASLTLLSAKLPIANFQLLDSSFAFLQFLDAESKIHLLSNLLTFIPPRYPQLSAESLDAYLGLLVALLNGLPTRILDPSDALPNGWRSADDDSDVEPEIDPEDSTSVLDISLDPRTRKRLQTLPSSSHLNALLRRTWDTPALISFVVALVGALPSKKTDILAAVLAQPKAGALYATHIYRTRIRDSVIGMNAVFSDSTHSALALLLDLYTQALATMGDDEFFSFLEPDGQNEATRSEAETSAAWNPLSRDDLNAFTRQLMLLVCELYFSENAGDAHQEKKVVYGRRDLLLQIREKSVRCLQAIHARDSRRQFLPEGHWQEGLRINSNAFIEVAAQEEEQCARVGTDGSTSARSARERSFFAPRLAILHAVPFALPFLARAAIFQRWLETNRHTSRPARRHRRDMTRITIRRDRVAQDGFEQLQDVDLRHHIHVSFVNKLGVAEGNAGHHGLYKEFFTAICKEVFDAERGLWFENEKHEIYPSSQSSARTPQSLQWFKFVGRILGKAIFDGILIDFAFAGFFLAKWLGRQGYLDDLASLDPALYKGLIFLKHYPGDVEDLALNFTADVEDGGVMRTIELLPGGNDTAVTKENRLQYIYLISHFRLSWQIKPQSQAFFEGLSELIEPRWLKMFNQQELQTLLGGTDSGIDVEDLRANTRYEGTYENDKHATIVAFWNVVRTFDQKQRRALLLFVTSCSRPPLMGFKHLHPHFTIQDMGDTAEHLPGAATCSNLLLLPRYTDEAVLREKLLSAIMSESGF